MIKNKNSCKCFGFGGWLLVFVLSGQWFELCESVDLVIDRES